jgi:hypothetical protein
MADTGAPRALAVDNRVLLARLIIFCSKKFDTRLPM